MAKGRMLSATIAKDARLNGLSLEAEYVYLKAIPHLDRDGLIEGDPEVLWGKVCPKRRKLLDRMESIIQEWSLSGLVLLYDDHGENVLWFKGFAKNQMGMRYDREARSNFNPPPEQPDFFAVVVGCPPTTAAEEVRQSDGRTPAELRQNSGGLPEEVRQTDGKYPREQQIEQQQQIEVEVENNNKGALRTLVLAEAETAVVVVGAEQLIKDWDDEQIMALLTWLWLYNGWNQDDLDYRDHFRREYKRDPFAGMNSPGAVMVRNAKARTPAPLKANDRAEMRAKLRERQEVTP